MIVVQLLGGLGNQLFQYAAAMHLAEINNTELRLDTSAFRTQKLRAVKMHHFNISADVILDAELKAFLDGSWPQMRSKGKAGIGRAIVYKEPHFQFDQKMLSLRGQIYIEGYWQSEKYFLEIERIIRREFVVKTPPDAANQKLAEKIRNENSVSLHVRRGDYVNSAATNSYHGLCTLEYYAEAIKSMAMNMEKPHFFIFSDDIPWTRHNLKSRYTMTYVDLNGPERDYEDLRLMSFCKNHIVANSSFSWWGAWLCPDPHKAIIAPQRWFSATELDCEDLVPNSWRRI